MRLSILSLGVSLLGLPVALAQVPVPAQYLAPPPAPAPVPYPLKVKPSTPQATLTGVPALPSTPPIMPSPPTKPFSTELTWSMSSAPASTKPKTRVFEVADLVHAPLQIPGAAALENTKGTTAHTLMKLIVAMAKPDTWERHGGAGKIEFITASDCLCVTNSPDAVAEVAKVLDGLRRMQANQVSVEMRLFTVPAGLAAKAGWPTPTEKCKCPTKCWTLDEFSKAAVLIQENKRVSVMTFPRMSFADGQAGYAEVGHTAPLPQTATKAGAPIQAVEAGSYYIGTKFTCTPTESMDGKSVRLKMNTSHLCPIGAGGWEVQTLQNDSTVVLPCDNFAVIYLGTVSVEERTETRVPALAKLPYLDRLFRSVGVGVVEQDVYQIVTVRRLKDVDFAPAATAPVAPCCKPGVELRLNLTAPKPVVVPQQVFSHGSGWFGFQ